MPIWGEFLNTRMRLEDVDFLMASFTTGFRTADTTSHYGTGAVSDAVRSRRCRRSSNPSRRP